MSDADKEVQKEVIKYSISAGTVKQAVKEAAKEMIAEQIEEFGRWTLKCLIVMAFAGLIWLALKGQGWSK